MEERLRSKGSSLRQGWCVARGLRGGWDHRPSKQECKFVDVRECNATKSDVCVAARNGGRRGRLIARETGIRVCLRRGRLIARRPETTTNILLTTSTKLLYFSSRCLCCATLQSSSLQQASHYDLRLRHLARHATCKAAKGICAPGGSGV